MKFFAVYLGGCTMIVFLLTIAGYWGLRDQSGLVGGLLGSFTAVLLIAFVDAFQRVAHFPRLDLASRFLLSVAALGLSLALLPEWFSFGSMGGFFGISAGVVCVGSLTRG
ncbi:MAG: hypothetical protein NXI30_16920 [bacterium]|nr:hypothetical protein [bacterium]